MFPKEIKEAAAPYVNKTKARKMKLFLYGLYFALFLYWAISAHLAGTTGFWPLFWTGYAKMTLVSISDSLILDCWLPQKIRDRIKGAEHCKAWEQKEWLLKLAIPEHALGWTFLVCPIAGLIVAGIAAFLSRHAKAPRCADPGRDLRHVRLLRLLHRRRQKSAYGGI